MLLTISTTRQPASDLSFLLHKHPAKIQEVEIPAGKAHIFYPEVSIEKCPENINRLKKRGLSAKRSLALREFALGLEGLQRFINKEPLSRVHACVFGVLALESEPVDPRL